ncbi:PadR family transcriptional regulator [Streptomyces sp. MAR4 CNX-425]|uniref:PadR family transcriptional regulator n=1 Tax=Streptomyces sp. MAR4 CNX-425 TaxID=3406343 RepID=UPI003B505275
MPTLSASAYVVLGLLEQMGPTTPYALDREIQQSVGHFWDFPRSQIYAEAARLARRGLVTEDREATGRRRRTLSLTQQGRDTLADWLTGPAERATDVRDEGLLRLYFQRDGVSDAGEVRRLAEAQVEAHRRKLAEYEAILATAPPRRARGVAGAGAADAGAGAGSVGAAGAAGATGGVGAGGGVVGAGPRFGAPQAAALAFGLRFEELAVAYWTEVAERGMGSVDPRPGRG